jgi:hypothetical protein
LNFHLCLCLWVHFSVLSVCTGNGLFEFLSNAFNSLVKCLCFKPGYFFFFCSCCNYRSHPKTQ